MFTLVATKVLNDPAMPEECRAGIHVRVRAEGGTVDRRDVFGWHLGATTDADAMADRLVRAVNAGRAITVNGVLTDVNHQTYLNTSVHVMGRRLNADLLRLGF